MNMAKYILLLTVFSAVPAASACVTNYCNWSIQEDSAGIHLTHLSPKGCIPLSESQLIALNTGKVRLSGYPKIEETRPANCPDNYKDSGEIQGGVVGRSEINGVFSTSSTVDFESRRTCFTIPASEKAKDQWNKLSQDIESAGSTAVQTSRQLLRELLKEAQKEPDN